MSKKILIVCALPQETQNELNEYDVLYTGVGKINATYALTRHLPLNFDYDLIVNYGTSASKTQSGLVDCTKFIQRDMDATPMGFDMSETPFDNEPSMIDFSHINNPIGNNLTCYTGDSFVTDIQDMDVGNADDWEKNCGKGVLEFKKILNHYEQSKVINIHTGR